MLFIMTWYILRHIGIFFATRPVGATLCAIAYIVIGVVSFRQSNKGKDYDTRKNAENIFLFFYCIPIFLAILVVIADILLIPLYIRSEATYDDALGFFALTGGICVVILFVLALWGHDFPELGAP